MLSLLNSVQSKPVQTNANIILFRRVHRLETETCSLHDAGDYTFVPEGYSQSLSCKLHIIGKQPMLHWIDIMLKKHLNVIF